MKLKKLIFILGIGLYSNLFAAAVDETIPPQRVAHPLTSLPVEIIQGYILPHLSPKDQEAFLSVNFEIRRVSPTALIFNMETAQEQDTLHVIEFLKRRKDIQKLKIASVRTSILMVALRALSEDPDFGFRRLAELDLSGNRDRISVPLLEILQDIAPKLKTLNVYCCNIGVAEAASISASQTLTDLNISSNNLGDEGAASISILQRLTTLGIADNNLGSAGVNSISTLQRLKILGIGDNNLGDAEAATVGLLHNLMVLNMGGNRIGDGAKLLLTTVLLHTFIRF